MGPKDDPTEVAVDCVAVAARPPPQFQWFLGEDPLQVSHSAQTINKMTSHFWGFDPSRPTLPHPHPLDNFSLSFPNLHSSLSNHFFKMTSPDSEAGRQLFQFRSTS